MYCLVIGGFFLTRLRAQEKSVCLSISLAPMKVPPTLSEFQQLLVEKGKAWGRKATTRVQSKDALRTHRHASRVRQLVVAAKELAEGIFFLLWKMSGPHEDTQLQPGQRQTDDSKTYRNGFSPVWVRMCFLRSLSVVKYLLQPSDSQLNVFPVWSLWCAFSLRDSPETKSLCHLHNVRKSLPSHVSLMCFRIQCLRIPYP